MKVLLVFILVTLTFVTHSNAKENSIGQLNGQSERKSAAPVKVIKKYRYQKVQEVNFSGDQVNGMAKTPMSSFIMQNKAMKFIPLYRVRKKFDEDLIKSLQRLR